ncbi:MAG TPA: STAS domain-containing protein [Acidobacteriaceae bacterium]
MPDTAAAAPTLTMEVKHCAGNVIVVYCHGRLVSEVSELLYTRISELIPSTHRIVLDLSDLKHTDSMGLGTLVRLYVKAKSANCSLELINLSKQIRHLLGLTNLFAVFTVIGENGVKFM